MFLCGPAVTCSKQQQPNSSNARQTRATLIGFMFIFQQQQQQQQQQVSQSVSPGRLIWECRNANSFKNSPFGHYVQVAGLGAKEENEMCSSNPTWVVICV